MVKKHKNQEKGIVYSTDQGKMCPVCNQSIDKCTCKKNNEIPETDGIVRVSRETKGRKGKGVTLVTGVPLNHKELKILGKQLKKRCGTGGTVKEGVIEIQGDQRDTLMEELTKKGWAVKRSGG